jgi:hypothetical protein
MVCACAGINVWDDQAVSIRRFAVCAVGTHARCKEAVLRLGEAKAMEQDQSKWNNVEEKITFFKDTIFVSGRTLSCNIRWLFSRTRDKRQGGAIQKCRAG